jgi:hypothetical protein
MRLSAKLSHPAPLSIAQTFAQIIRIGCEPMIAPKIERMQRQQHRLVRAFPTRHGRAHLHDVQREHCLNQLRVRHLAELPHRGFMQGDLAEKRGPHAQIIFDRLAIGGEAREDEKRIVRQWN